MAFAFDENKMTDEEFEFLSLLEKDGPFEVYGRKPEHKNDLALDLHRRGLADCTNFSNRGPGHHLFVDLRISENGRTKLKEERQKREKRSLSGVSKKAGLFTIKKIGALVFLVISTIVVIKVKEYYASQADTKHTPQAEDKPSTPTN